MGVTKYLSFVRGYKNQCNCTFQRQYCIKNFGNYKPWKVKFFGTDEFSLSSLRLLHDELQNGSIIKQLDVVTTISKTGNPVLQFAESKGLHIQGWPVNNYKLEEYDIGLVVSFGHLIPERIINSFKFGMINVHASLLPRWRGAAPIIYSIKHGDTITGVSVMKIKPKHFDIGEVIAQSEVSLDQHILMPDLRKLLSNEGATLLLESVKKLPNCLDRAIQQDEKFCTYAPRVSSSLAIVEWTKMTAKEVYNLYRAVSGVYSLATTWHGLPVKLHKCLLDDIFCDRNVSLNKKQIINQNILKSGVVNLRNMSDMHQHIENNVSSQFVNSKYKPGLVRYDKKRKLLSVLCNDGRCAYFDSVGVTNKRTMSALDFNNGFLKKKPSGEHYFS